MCWGAVTVGGNVREQPRAPQHGNVFYHTVSVPRGKNLREIYNSNGGTGIGGGPAFFRLLHDLQAPIKLCRVCVPPFESGVIA